ncbi:MAG: hypothetical protein QM811_06875 [Pirellulales bacterium]
MPDLTAAMERVRPFSKNTLSREDRRKLVVAMVKSDGAGEITLSGQRIQFTPLCDLQPKAVTT